MDLKERGIKMEYLGDFVEWDIGSCNEFYIYGMDIPIEYLNEIIEELIEFQDFLERGKKNA